MDALEATELEYTRIANGWFLDYYGMPHRKTHLHPWINLMSVEDKWAVLPGDGSAKAHFLTTQDMAKFVAHLMDMSSWPKVCSIVGEELELRQVVRIAEKARGKELH